ncbi:MAG: hypothetical protein ACPHX9_00110 [Candidatus Poseidoniaceae archaeon]
MNKGLAIAGGTLMVLSILVFFVSLIAVMGHGPDSDNILHDTETDGMTYTYDGEVTLLEVYAKGDVDCNTFTVSISDEMFEYFWPNCESETTVEGYTYLGDLEVYSAGNYNIDAEDDIVIIDADGLILPGLSFCGGGVCCLVGLILLIVGLSVGKKAPQVVVFQQPDGTMFQPNQTTVHQYIPPSTPVHQEQTPVDSPFTEEIPTDASTVEPFSFEHKNQL